MENPYIGFLEWIEKTYSYGFVGALGKLSANDYLELMAVFANQYNRYIERRQANEENISNFAEFETEAETTEKADRPVQERPGGQKGKQENKSVS